MPWPGPSEYQRVIQNPRICFYDPELKAGTVVLTPLGLPRVASGNFACVYEIRSGARRIAVKCFIRQISDLRRRYGLISQHLQGFWLPQLVRFEYQEQGILVQKQLYPIVKMDWVDGVPLHTFVERHLGDANTLLGLAQQWRALITGLQKARIAHGDLQHGNILVSAGQLRLVDYDGMFVPPLLGERAPELGHPNYQHPKRTAKDYDKSMDNFSALVIYLTLRALAAEPRLWHSFHTGENLIFLKSDFDSPGQTPIWQQLWQSPDKDVQQLTEILEQVCVASPTQLPDLKTILQAIRRPPKSKTTLWKDLIIGDIESIENRLHQFRADLEANLQKRLLEKPKIFLFSLIAIVMIIIFLLGFPLLLVISVLNKVLRPFNR